MHSKIALLLLTFFCAAALSSRVPRQAGLKLIGPLVRTEHNVQGNVYLKADNSAIVIKDFSYDGLAAGVYLNVATSGSSRKDWLANKMQLDPDSGALERAYSKETVEVPIPASVKAADIKWLTIWCEAFGVSFGEVQF